MVEELKDKSLTTADLAATEERTAQGKSNGGGEGTVAVIENQEGDGANEEEQLAPLFLPDVAKDFRSRWDTVQRSFVDDPRQAVRQADELVAQVMKSLAETFSNERTKLEAQLEEKDKASTENLRLALRRYRSFFERLLSL